LGDEHLVPTLVGLLDRPALVPAVAQALVRLHDRYHSLYREGQHVADLVRQHAPSEAAPQMLSMLNSVTGDTLRAVVRVLGWMESENVVSELTRLLASSEVRNE